MPKIADIEYTPNPNAVKFILKEPLTVGSSRSFQNAEAASDDVDHPTRSEKIRSIVTAWLREHGYLKQA